MFVGMYRIVIVGGGIAGLAAAWELVSSAPDVEVTILEQTDRVGGKLRREKVGGHLVDVGAEAMLALRPEARHLIEEIGAGADLVTPATVAASVYSYGALHPMPPRSMMGIPQQPGDAAGILSDAEVARLAAPEPVPPLESDASVGDYVAAALGDAVVDRLVEPLLGGVYAGQARKLSLAATMPQLYARAVDGEPPVAYGTQKHEATSPGPKPPPATPDSEKLSAPSPSPFIGLRGGVGRLPEIVADAVRERGVQIRTGVTVRGIAPQPAGGWRLTCGPTTDVEHVYADAVILTTPAAATRKLLEPVAPEAAELIAGIETASAAVVTFAFPSAQMPDLAGSGFLVPPVEGFTVKASTFSSNKWAWMPEQFPDVTYVRASLGRHGDEAALQRSDDDLADLALTDLTGILGVTLPAPIGVHVQRWGGGLPQYGVGHLDRIALLRKEITNHAGLQVAGAAYDGVGIPAVIASGRRAAQDLAATAGLRD